MSFSIAIKQGSRLFHLLAEQIFVNARVQRYKIWPVEDPKKYLILENNKPLIRNKLKLKNRKIDWTVIEHTGPKISKGTVQQFVNAIIAHYAPPEQQVELSPIPARKKTRKESMQGPKTTLGERNQP
jgi:hypothetical protein